MPAAPFSDDQLMAFARANEPYRVENNAQGEIIVMTPVGRREGKRELYLAFELERWAERDGRAEVDGSSTGWNRPDGSRASQPSRQTGSQISCGY